jgi:hypothetical protein
VIEPDDVRRIRMVQPSGELLAFVCGDADGARDFTIIAPAGQPDA